MSGFELAARLSAETDAFIGGRLFHELIGHAQPDCDIVALGGYGRREMCPASDIDLLFLFSGKFNHAEAESVVKALAYPLWDKGLTVGLSVRSVSETINDAANDTKLYAALLDARFICGSSIAYQDLCARFEKMTQGKPSRHFLKELAKLNSTRRETWGDARYRLEPNLKDGALRDYHCVRWYAQLLTGNTDPQGLVKAGYLEQSEVDDLLNGADFLIATRYNLHQSAGRKTDNLSLEMIPEVAAAMLADDERSFMRSLHRAARQVRFACEACEEALYARRPRRTRWLNFASDPLSPTDELAQVATGKAKPSHRLRRQLKNLTPLDAPFIKNILLDVITNPGAESALKLMLETGLLEQAVPIFSRVVGLSTFDPAHTYSVDLHSLRCVGELIKLESEKSEIAAQVGADGLPLRLAALLHDIGKGSGQDHSRLGVSLSMEAVQHLGLSKAQARTISDLVGAHLKLSELALGRDLSDENTIYDLARLIKTPEKLAMLYLLTIADTRATAPSLWSAWRASLIDELYNKTRHLLITGEAAGKMNTLNRRWQALSGESGRLWALPQAYVLNYDPDEIRRHLSLTADQLKDDEIRLSHTEHGGHTELTVFARERSGLFADLTGLFALNELKILSARIFTWQDGTCVDRFDVKLPWENFDAWPRIQKQYAELSAGRLDLEERLRQKKNCQIKAGIVANLDNNASDFFSLLRVDAPESTAMLHAVASTLSAHGLNIHRAYLASRGSRAVITFYLTDIQGEKLPEDSTKLLEELQLLGQTC